MSDEEIDDFDGDCTDCHATIALAYGDEHTDPPLCHECEKKRLEVRVRELEAKLNTPETESFVEGVKLEAAHQRERWGSDHDGGKAPSDWFWLIGYLAGKALAAHLAGNVEKALHHTISSAAALANWHAAILGQTNMRPGIEPPKEG